MAQSIPAPRKLKLAAVQASPVFLDLTATTKKAADLIRQAGAEGANVIGFPESFIPGYPGWVPFLGDADPIKSALYLQMFNNSMVVPGPEVEALQAACKEGNINAVVGITERHANTLGTLYNTQLIIGRDGTLLEKHQKVVPTVGERLIHAPGTTGSKTATQTDFGGISGLICGENMNPLAQWATSLSYPVVHVASWPSFLTIGHELDNLIDIAGKAVSFSVGTFVIASASIVGDDEIEAYAHDPKLRAWLKGEQKRHRAKIFGPGGQLLAQSSDDSSEELVYAEVNPEIIKAFKHMFDWAGHYNRPDVFAPLFKNHNSA
ncbi:hypothetical protein J1614_004261 [Plenodomus biglobosus]|nr:hypothetical protein J1614_004261 [Plenodomus biglobosus]